jgi:DNA-binding NarL/FixJ family response regulator
MIRIIIVDDHALFRAGLKALLHAIPDMKVVAEADGGHEALRQIETHRPEVALVDISMPGLNGLTATSRIASAFPETKVLILSMHADEEYARQAMAAGASGYLLKAARREELEDAIRTVARGETYLTTRMAEAAAPPPMGRPAATPMDRLTFRQREVLQLLAEGHKVRDIASRLGLSAKTVETHRSQIMQRLDIYDVPGLVRFAIRNGMVSAET